MSYDILKLVKYAIIAISGTQHKVQEDDTLVVDSIDGKEGDVFTTDQVLLTVDDKTVKVGTPTVKDASVEYKIVKNYKGEKLKVFKYKAKSRYQKTQGHRSLLTSLKITKITA